MADFELRIRSTEAGHLRLCLLPHRQAGGVDQAWSKIRPDRPPPVDPDDSSRPREVDRGELWLPAYGTELVLEGLSVRLISDLGARRSLTLQARDADGRFIPTETTPPADDASRLSCYAGLQAMRDEPAVGMRETTDEAINSHRYAKLSVLQLIEAWRFPGSLLEYSELGPAELMACLSHLVFEIQPDDSRDTLAALRSTIGLTLRLAHPADRSVGLAQEEGLLAEKDLEGRPVNHPVDLILPGQERPVPQLLRVNTTQKAGGIFFELLDEGAPAKFSWLTGALRLEDCKLLLGRSTGPIPAPAPPVIASSYMQVERMEPENGPAQELSGRPIRIADPLSPEAFASEQLNYQLQVIDQFGDRVAAVSVAILRERFDSPPAASQPVARLGFDAAGGAYLEVEALFPGLENQLPARGQIPVAGPLSAALEKSTLGALERAFAAELFFQGRPLDECGFYGDDDDLALLEGLQQADPSYDPPAALDSSSPIANHPLEDYLRGRFDREGLREFSLKDVRLTWDWFAPKQAGGTADDAPARKIPRVTLRLERLAPGTPTWFVAQRGYHFHIGLRRNEVSNREVRAPLAMCRHELLIQAKEETRLAVFQLEWFIPPRPDENVADLNRRFLAREYFTLMLVRRTRLQALAPGERRTFVHRPDEFRERGDGDLPIGVELVYSHPAVGHTDFKNALVPTNDPVPLPIGGVRILVRDQAAVGQALPFREAETIQALPRLVALYRPVQIEAGLDASIAEPSLVEALAEDLPPNYWERLSAGSLAKPTDASIKTTADATLVFAPGGLQDRLNAAVQVLTGQPDSPFRRRGGLAPVAPIEMAVELTEAEMGPRLEELRGDTAGDLGQQMQAWAMLHRRAPAARKDEVRQAFLALFQPRLTSQWTTWLNSARQRLGLDPEQLGAGRLIRDQKVIPAAATHWPLLGLLVAVMREAGLAQDIVVRMAFADDAWKVMEKEVSRAGFADELLILGLETADGGDTMATFRLVLVPWGTLLTELVPDGPDEAAKQRHALFRASARGPIRSPGAARLFRLRDGGGAPLNLPIRDGRLVRYTWLGLSDYWHHDLEFAVQLLDRYHRIRELYQRTVLRQGKGIPDPDPANLEPELAARLRERHEQNSRALGRDIELEIDLQNLAVRTVVVPRREPVAPHPGVLPAAFRPDYVIAFEMQDSDERQKSAHNILTRTRHGHIQAQWTLRGSLTDAAEFPKALASLATLPEAGRPDFSTAWHALRQRGIEIELATDGGWFFRPRESNGDGQPESELPWLEWRPKPGPSDLVDRDARRPIPARPAGDVIAYPGQPYFLTHRFDCWYIADFLKGQAATAVATRLPLQLGLPARPTFRYEHNGTETRLTLRLVPPALRDHLTLDERENLERADQESLTGNLAFHLRLAGVANPESWLLRLVDLPDLRTEITFYLNFNPGEGTPKLKPILRWLRNDPDAADSPTRPLGFSLETVDAIASKPEAHGTPALVALSATLDPQADPRLLQSPDLAQAGQRVFLTLRRGGLASGFLPLIHKP